MAYKTKQEIEILMSIKEAKMAYKTKQEITSKYCLVFENKPK